MNRPIHAAIAAGLLLISATAAALDGKFKVANRYCVDGTESASHLTETGSRNSPADVAPQSTVMYFTERGDAAVISRFPDGMQVSEGNYSIVNKSYGTQLVLNLKTTAENMSLYQSYSVDVSKSSADRIVLFGYTGTFSSTLLAFFKGIGSCGDGKLGKYLVIELEREN